MRKLKLQVNITIDGYIASPDGKAEWMGPPDAEGLRKVIELADSCDTLLLGRRMTREFVGYWENVVDHQPDSPMRALAQRMVDIRKIVFSHTETDIKGRNLTVENGDLKTVVQQLKAEPGKDIIVYGGADFVSSLIREGLIDEYHLIVNPVAIGSGLSIFKDKTVLKLDSSVAFGNGKVWNRYLVG